MVMCLGLKFWVSAVFSSFLRVAYAGDGMSKMAPSLMCLVQRPGWLEQLEMDVYLSLFVPHVLSNG